MTPRRRKTDRQPSRELQLESQRNLLNEQNELLKREVQHLKARIEAYERQQQDTAHGELL